jgi:flagellar export protein FliJ
VTPPFRFRLERVRTVRKHSEDLAAQQLAGALDCQERSEQRLREADALITAARDARLDAAKKPLSGAELLATQDWLEGAERARETRLAALAHDEREVALRRTVLTEAAAKRKALDRLEERRRSEFDREERRREVNRLDEIALTQYGGSAA